VITYEGIKTSGNVHPPIFVLGIITLLNPSFAASCTRCSIRDTRLTSPVVDGLDCYIGEVGLTGEVRRVSRIEQRVQEVLVLLHQLIPLHQYNNPNHLRLYL
jgi:hypothetical protein